MSREEQAHKLPSSETSADHKAEFQKKGACVLVPLWTLIPSWVSWESRRRRVSTITVTHNNLTVFIWSSWVNLHGAMEEESNVGAVPLRLCWMILRAATASWGIVTGMWWRIIREGCFVSAATLSAGTLVAQHQHRHKWQVRGHSHSAALLGEDSTVYLFSNLTWKVLKLVKEGSCLVHKIVLDERSLLYTGMMNNVCHRTQEYHWFYYLFSLLLFASCCSSLDRRVWTDALICWNDDDDITLDDG